MSTTNRFMHPRNMYRTPPDFKQLAAEYPEFKKYSVTGLNGKITFDFKNQEALRLLSTILLKKDFDLDVELPVGKLVPTVPLRLNYLLWIEDLFNLNYDSKKKIKGIDIGTGASCIYPLLAAKKFQWSMVGTDINKDSIKNATKNIEKNNLQHLIRVLEVSEWDSLLPVAANDHYDFCMCNPPFHKFSNLNSDDDSNSDKGVNCEMYTVGGEVEFIQKIIQESETLKNSISIYTSMVGYKSSLGLLKNKLKAIGACAIAKAGFFQGQTARWGIAWTFQPDIKLKDFMPNKEFQKMKSQVKLRPPVSFNISDSYDSSTALAKLTKLLADLKMSISLLKSEKDENILFQADIKAYENTWTHQRRKRRMEQKSNDNKRQKTNDNLSNESDDEKVEQNLETSANINALFAATLVLRKTDDTLWIDMLHLDGNRDNSYQLFQFLKNRFV